MEIKPFTGIMLDMETLAVTGAPAILSIGAVRFRWEDGRCSEIATFYATIQPDDWTLPGLTVDGQTLAWWLRQSAEARIALEDKPQSLAQALYSLACFCMAKGEDPPLELWANGADWQWVQSARVVVGHVSHDYSRVRDLRTLRKLCGVSAGPAAHHALKDARAQVVTLEACLRAMTGAS